jgi:hypothetical protein
VIHSKYGMIMMSPLEALFQTPMVLQTIYRLQGKWSVRPHHSTPLPPKSKYGPCRGLSPCKSLTWTSARYIHCQQGLPASLECPVPTMLRPTCTHLPTPLCHRRRLPTCTDPPLLTHMTPPAHLPTLTSPRRTCAPPSLTPTLVLTCPRSQR